MEKEGEKKEGRESGEERGQIRRARQLEKGKWSKRVVEENQGKVMAEKEEEEEKRMEGKEGKEVWWHNS